MRITKLPRTAYFVQPGETFVPLMKGQSPAEFTVKAVTSGTLFGMLFGAANTYLGLKAGLTISPSIPISVVAFRGLAALGRPYTILEANMSQTIGSASSSIASGTIFTLPALFLWQLHPDLRQLTILAICGGLLGTLFMIPLRRFLICEEHGKLPFPEGMACAEVLVATKAGGGQAAGVFAGIGTGMLFELLTNGLRIVRPQFEIMVPWIPKAMLSISASPALIGVGFILGLRIDSVMVAGAALSWLVIIPLIDWWRTTQSQPVFPETHLRISELFLMCGWTDLYRKATALMVGRSSASRSPSEVGRNGCSSWSHSLPSS